MTALGPKNKAKNNMQPGVQPGLQVAPMQQMQVTVPENCGPGTTLQLMTPAGTPLQVQVPANMKPGQAFTVQYAAPQVAVVQAQSVMMAPPQQVDMNRSADVFGEANFIEQRIEMLEMCGIEAKNRYEVSTLSADPTVRKPGYQSMYIHEESECFERICCGPNRSLTLVVSQGNRHGPELLRFKKPFHIQGCCGCRPSFDITNSQGRHLGRVEDPCAFCALDQKVYDAQNLLKYKVYGSICQIALCCPCCGDVVFNVKDMAGGPDGEIRKIFTCGELCGLNNKFKVVYPQGAPQGDKALVLGATMLLDLGYFEQNKNQ